MRAVCICEKVRSEEEGKGREEDVIEYLCGHQSMEGEGKG